MSVEPEVGDRLAEEIFRVKPCFPLRIGKVQRPLLPDETVQRDRLLDWLQARVRRRAIFVIAEAGMGKTTLVADFVGKSRIRSFWYRLDEDDTDGLVFLRYLVASCQAVDPKLLPRSAALLAEPALEPTYPAQVSDALFSEIESLGEVPSAIVFDDFHLAESVPSIRALVERLIERAPAQLALIFISRRMPSLSIAALRSRGQMAELGREDLRFDEAETERLFCQSNQPLDAEMLHDLQVRTEGWAASLQLVKTAVEGRPIPQVRAFIRSLSGAEGDLYDYLAEEVVGDLTLELRGFLMRVALLDEAEPDIASVAGEIAPADARRLLVEAQRMGLLSKSNGANGSWRPHPLVREFLLSHLAAELGDGGVADLHRRLATSLELSSWRLASRHWAAAGDGDEVRRVVGTAVPAIVATGDLAAAEDLITRYPDPSPNPWFEILRARGLRARGRYSEALEAGLRAAKLEALLATANPALRLARDISLLQLGAELQDHDLVRASTDSLLRSNDEEMALIARAAQGMLDSANHGSIDEVRAILLNLLKLNEDRGHSRFSGITLINLSALALVQGNAEGAVEAGERAVLHLATSGCAVDLASAHLNLARGLAHLGRWTEAEGHVELATDASRGWVEPEAFGECAELFAMYDDPRKGRRILTSAFAEDERGRGDPVCRYVAARLALAMGNTEHARTLLSQVGERTMSPGFRSSSLSLNLQVRALDQASDGSLTSAFEEALDFAEGQQAWFWVKTIRLTQALVSTSQLANEGLVSLQGYDRAYLSVVAELVVRRLGDFDPSAFGMVMSEAVSRPERWRWVIRQFLVSCFAKSSDTARAVELLEAIGTLEDMLILRAISHRKALQCPNAGRALVRRLAPRVMVEDLGRMTLRIGDRVVAGTSVRKKVLSLLGFLLTRPQFTATREQVLDALWPDLDPGAGANSLNQTAYFLRHEFEPDYHDDFTAGYLHTRADLIWLDPDLIESRSSISMRLIRSMGRDPEPNLVSELAETYAGRFAIDFIYDDWATGFRDALHASFLERMEKAVRMDTSSGTFDRAIAVAQKAILADPDADQIELCLLRLYRLTGAHAAAAEQYAHYATVLRDQLGVEPPLLESI